MKIKEPMDLGTRMKMYEHQNENSIPENEHIIVRIDGHHFSKFTKKFNKPFDEIFSNTMIETTKDLTERFTAFTGYTQSDEITLVIPSLMDTTNYDVPKNHKPHKTIKKGWTHINNGRTQKIVSLTAAYATMRFNHHFKKFTELYFEQYVRNEDSQNDFELIRTYNQSIGNAWFDARVFGVPSDEEAFNAVLWRIRDCVKNSKSMYAQAYCSHKELMYKNGQEQIDFCLEKTGNDWNEIAEHLKYGTLVKKELYQKETEHGSVQRSQITTTVMKPTFSKENVKFVMSKYF